VAKKTKPPSASVSAVQSSVSKTTAYPAVSSFTAADPAPPPTSTVSVSPSMPTRTSTAPWSRKFNCAPIRPMHADSASVTATADAAQPPAAASKPSADVCSSQRPAVGGSMSAEDSNLSVAASKALFESRNTKPSAKLGADTKPGDCPHGQQKSGADVTVGRSVSMSVAHRPTTNADGVVHAASPSAAIGSGLRQRPSLTPADGTSNIKAWKNFVSSYSSVNK
jgi:hypothetical protein